MRGWRDDASGQGTRPRRRSFVLVVLVGILVLTALFARGASSSRGAASLDVDSATPSLVVDVVSGPDEEEHALPSEPNEELPSFLVHEASTRNASSCLRHTRRWKFPGIGESSPRVQFIHVPKAGACFEPQ